MKRNASFRFSNILLLSNSSFVCEVPAKKIFENKLFLCFQIFVKLPQQRLKQNQFLWFQVCFFPCHSSVRTLVAVRNDVSDDSLEDAFSQDVGIDNAFDIAFLELQAICPGSPPRVVATQKAVDVVNPIRNLHCTILRLMGLDDNKLTYFHGGRFKQLSQTGGEVINELIA